MTRPLSAASSLASVSSPGSIWDTMEVLLSPEASTSKHLEEETVTTHDPIIDPVETPRSGNK